ncbi:MAG: head-tail connector protein [Eubacteriales bacterium]
MDQEMSLLDSARLALRITGKDLDSEIGELIAAAKKEMSLAGVCSAKLADETDPLIRRAAVVYVKAEFGLDNPDAEKYRESFRMMLKDMVLSNEYLYGENTEDVE